MRTYRRLSAYDDYSHPVNVKPFGFNDDLERDTSYSGKSGARPSLDKRLSSASSRLSLGSIKSVQKPVQLQQIERTPSQYSHKRDTQFDAYVARHGSVKRKDSSDRVMSGDFSYGSPVTTPDELTVPSRPRAASAPRAPSWGVEHGLVAVPEEEDEMERGGKDMRDREALLGNNRRESGERNSLHGPAIPQAADVTEPKWQRQ